MTVEYELLDKEELVDGFCVFEDDDAPGIRITDIDALTKFLYQHWPEKMIERVHLLGNESGNPRGIKEVIIPGNESDKLRGIKVPYLHRKAVDTPEL